MITFERFERSDFDRLIGWIDSSKLLVQWAGPQFSYPLDRVQLESYIYNSEHGVSKNVIFKVLINNIITGHIELCDLNIPKKSAMLTRFLIGNPKARGKGFGQKICKTFLDHAYNIYGIETIDLFVFDDNFPALNCYRKIGFTEEGYFPDTWEVDSSKCGIYHLRYTRQHGKQLDN
jgi:RimJ/RimL family protein N-acetyltransferase